jgi:hypothetical protein
MADNPQKRAIVNRALSILNGGRTSEAGQFFTSLTDAQFADWATIDEAQYPDARLAVMLYEPVLKQVIEDMQPDFARAYADLGTPMKINQAFGGWDQLFEVPTDFLKLVKQVYEGNKSKWTPCEMLQFKGYSHVVVGTDGQAYYCSTGHTAATQPPAANWTLYSADGSMGATWVTGTVYKASATGWMLATNHLTNEDGDSAYIEYLAYVQTTSGGAAGRSDQPAYYPESFKNALATRLAAEMTLDGKDYERRTQLLREYENLAKPAYWASQNTHQEPPRAATVFERRTA